MRIASRQAHAAQPNLPGSCKRCHELGSLARKSARGGEREWRHGEAAALGEGDAQLLMIRRSTDLLGIAWRWWAAVKGPLCKG
jgi:hypothetical protein